MTEEYGCTKRLNSVWRQLTKRWTKPFSPPVHDERGAYLQTKFLKEAGSTIIENLTAVALFGIVLAGSSRFVIYSIGSNHSARAYTSLAAQVQKIVDGYRVNSYGQLLNNFGSTYSAIADGQTVTNQTAYQNGQATFTTTLTAIKASNTSYPEAVKVSVEAIQRRGKLGNVRYNYETYIAQIR